MRRQGFAPIIVILIVISGLIALVLFRKNFQTTPSDTKSTPTPESALLSLSPSPCSTSIKPTPTPYGLNDPISSDGHCYAPEDNWSMPPKGVSPLYVTLFASGPGFDYTYAAIVGYQWDFDGNGTWDTNLVSEPKIGHIYSQNGTFKPKLRARSSKNTWTPTCDYGFTVVVGETQEYTNSSISVDKINVSVTISKSAQQKVVGFIVSTKDKGIPIRFEGDINNITESSGADLNAGMSFAFHLFASPSTLNDTYNREVTLKYATENGTVWNNGPLIHYVITVTD